MYQNSIIGLVLMLAFSTSTFAGGVGNVPYDFQGDQLGVGLDKFLTKHHNPGFWSDKVKCNKNAICKSTKVWNTKISCKANGKNLTVCVDDAKIFDDADARAIYLFVDNQLASIRVSLGYGAEQIEGIKDAMKNKVGEPVFQANDERFGSATYWENKTSVAVLYEHVCVFGFGSNLDYLLGWSREMFSAINGLGCKNSDSMSYNQSMITFVHKEISSLAIKRIDEYEVETNNK